MGVINFAEWQKMPVSLLELCINTTLRCGQSFRWRKNDAGIWSIALHNRILCLHQDAEYLYYRSLAPIASTTVLPTPPSSLAPPSPTPSTDEPTSDLIANYFNLTPNLTALYDQWSTADANFALKAPRVTGVRILQQDAFETLAGFICSSNNNIARIGQMVHRLCARYGPLLGHIDGVAYHDFPAPAALARPGVEAELRALGFGYRAKFIHGTARALAAQPRGWLDALQAPRPGTAEAAAAAGTWTDGGREGYQRARAELMALPGVGPKVADCTCLMGLGWGEAVPVDTHILRIAERDYRFGRARGALTRGTYDAIGDRFRALWGRDAGWAQSVLFTADLRALGPKEGKSEAGGEVADGSHDGEKAVEVGTKREAPEDDVSKVKAEAQETPRGKRRRRG